MTLRNLTQVAANFLLESSLIVHAHAFIDLEANLCLFAH